MDGVRPGYLKMELQSRGVRIATATPAAVRSGGAGPAQGLTLLIDGRPVSVPAGIPATARSPYTFRPGNGGGVLDREGAVVGTMKVVADGGLLSRAGRDGVPFGMIAQLHGDDCLASTVLQSCAYWDSGAACRFCAIGASLEAGRTVEEKTPEQLAEVAAVAAEVGVRHVVLTTGCAADRAWEVRHLAACTRAVKEASGLPVQVQCLPPRDLALLDELRDAGADTIGLHIESMDPRVLARIAPIKAGIGWRGYVEAWRRAVALFGRWQTTTYVIMGLGECLDLTMARIASVVDLGVYPHVVPLRPILGSPLEDAVPPPPETMSLVYAHTASTLRRAGGSWRTVAAGCGRCTACSALSDWEDAASEGWV